MLFVCAFNALGAAVAAAVTTEFHITQIQPRKMCPGLDTDAATRKLCKYLKCFSVSFKAPNTSKNTFAHVAAR